MRGKLGLLAIAVIVAGFGIKSQVRCGQATYVDTYAIVALADRVVPGFDVCD
ncbi:hypothetical protein HPA02_34560 [Bisbaumannia pacifica]|uniref:Uncharacterized protein n=1 Tax=Bisbaumannia pacifica TaxID=77098 RepID=A0A510XCQ9_9GAMM|nr:hypothetical protein [Halomonas pacifica]GEK49173.1 hypothetical protein HPA02_34560 [Halomonas pacifica]